MTKECKQQFTLRITQANPTQMIVILYEMLLCYLEEAKDALGEDDKAAFSQALRKARACINELMRSLNMEYEPAPGLLQLYLYCIRRLAISELHKKKEAIDEIVKVIEPLHDAYMQIADLNPAGPVMNNSQSVYAGLTYGRNTLTENMADQGANRGMLV